MDNESAINDNSEIEGMSLCAVIRVPTHNKWKGIPVSKLAIALATAKYPLRTVRQALSQYQEDFLQELTKQNDAELAAVKKDDINEECMDTSDSQDGTQGRVLELHPE